MAQLWDKIQNPERPYMTHVYVATWFTFSFQPNRFLKPFVLPPFSNILSPDFLVAQPIPSHLLGLSIDAISSRMPSL